MESPAADPFDDSSSARIVELATLARRVRQLAGEFARRGEIERLLGRSGTIDRDRFAGIDRRLMPDRLRVPPEIVELLLETAR